MRDFLEVSLTCGVSARALHLGLGARFFLRLLGRNLGQFSHHSSNAGRASGLFYASPYFYILDIHQLVMKKIAALVETTESMLL